MDNEKKQVTYNSSITGETQVTFDIQQYMNWSISSQSPTRYAFEAVYQTGYRQFGRIVN